MDTHHTTKKGDEVPASPTSAYKFEALLFSSIDSNLAVPLSLNHPSKSDTKPHEVKGRRDSRASRSSIHRSSSVVFRALPPIRRMPSLQVPSLTDISNPHNIPNPRSLNQISETEATSFKLKLPLTLVHPNSPYVPWELPVRQKILCTIPVSNPGDSTDDDDAEASGSEEKSRDPDTQRDKKPLSSVWNALKSAPKRVKTKCRRLLSPRAREAIDFAAGDSGASSNASGQKSDIIVAGPEDEDVGEISYIPQHHTGLPLSPTASFRSAETHSLATWLAERQRKFLDKDCESARLMSIDEYERAGSWIRRKGDEDPQISRPMSHFHATKMGPKIRTPSIFVRTFGPKMRRRPDFYAPKWTSSRAMSYFYADGSQLAGGRARGKVVGGGTRCDFLWPSSWSLSAGGGWKG